jgi:amino acid adenylation domain-containing protein
MRLAFVFDTRAFDPAEVARWGDYYLRGFERLLENRDHSHRCSLLGEAERHRLLVQWNDTAVAYPRDVCIHQLIEEQVDRTPDAVALVYENEELSYHELNARANQLARYLREQGVRPDTLVALCMERSVEMLVGILGILKAGGAYVPLDPTYPAERLAYMIENSSPALLLTQSTLAPRFRDFPRAQLSLDLKETLAGYATTNLDAKDIGLTSRHLAYVIYTSGSTGRPKGVMNEHAALVNRLLWARDEYRVDPADRILQKTPFSFDVSVWELLLPLLAGAREIIARPNGHLDPAYLAEVLNTHEVTMVHFVPAMLQVFIDHQEVTDFPRLRRVICSGEALPYSLQLRWQARHPNIELHNLYGPTEAAIDVTAWRCVPGVHEGIVPIGRPIANIRMYVLDAQRDLVPLGVTGEVYIGGWGVARGYWNNETLTRERFVTDPFSADAGARLYRTGDVGRWLPDGAIEYLGRNDSQVKIRGFRIELGEIESQLRELPGVREAIVVARSDESGETRLVGYVVAEAGAEPPDGDFGEYRQALAARLPQYMVPTVFVMLDALPISANGKVDRKALPAPILSGHGEYVAPDTPTEVALAQMWAQLLGREPASISIDANFFELGGHSLMLMRMSAQLRLQFARAPSVRDLYEAMTIRQLALSLDVHGTKQRLDEELSQRAASELEEAEF